MDRDRLLAVQIHMRRGYADGGKVTPADKMAAKGRYGDRYVVHVNADEFDEMRRNWGEPTINPDTGAPEFFLGGLRKWFSKNPIAGALLSVGSNVLLPGLGSSIGEAANGALGGALSETAANALGSGVVGGGLSLLTGGDPLQGAILGGLTPIAMNSFGMNGAAPTPARDSAITTSDGVTGGNAGYAAPAAAAAPQGGGLSSLLPNVSSNPMPYLSAALSLLSSSQQTDPAADAAAKREQQMQDEYNAPLPKLKNRRKRVADSAPNYANYGETGGEFEYYDDNRPAYADGGNVPHGRSDTIEARLSPGEYVIDAETVALLGNGDNDAGAQALDRLRESVRAHKGEALSRGAISPDARSPLEYLRGT